MANQEHLEILRQGIRVWNEWRDDICKPDLSGADFRGLDYSDGDFSGTNLRGAHLAATGLRHTKLYASDLSGANLSLANLTGSDLRGADLSNTVLIATVLANTNLAHTSLLNARIGWTIFGGVDLSKVRYLESVIHDLPSTIAIDTVYQSGGNIPEKFLRGCGVPEGFITYMHSLVGKAIEFYSCFISYSSKDNEFARRLYADLQNEGVRCWFAPEDLKIGDRFRVRIDESIRVYDKLILILSENSVSSEWVGDEVEAALEKEEGQGGKVVLFPLRLDGAVMEIKSGWPAKVRRTRHIGDFSDWKSHDSYKKAFEGLMRDLKAGEGR